MNAVLLAIDDGAAGLALWHGFAPHIQAVIFAYARIAPACMLLPLFSEGMLAGPMVRQSLIVLIAVIFAPSVEFSAVEAFSSIGHAVWAIPIEGLIGAAIGTVLALPFWICIGIGELIDNQRGATISDVFDPAHGVEVSTFSAFISMYGTAVFLANDGMRVVVETLRASYVDLSYLHFKQIDWLACARLLDTVSRDALRLSAPVVGAMFVTEIVLGVLSCFATQMGAFSLAFSIKSFIAFAVFYLYFGPSFARMFATFGHLMPIPVLMQ